MSAQLRFSQLEQGHTRLHLSFSLLRREAQLRTCTVETQWVSGERGLNALGKTYRRHSAQDNAARFRCLFLGGR